MDGIPMEDISELIKQLRLRDDGFDREAADALALLQGQAEGLREALERIEEIWQDGCDWCADSCQIARAALGEKP